MYDAAEMTGVVKTERLQEGYSKVVYATNDPDKTVLWFKDTATAFRNIKRAEIKDKGIYTCRISSLLFKYLNDNGIKTHFLGQTGEREQLCRRADVLPIRVILRNVAAGAIVKLLGIEHGKVFSHPVTELTLKDNELDNPIINRDHADALGVASYEETDFIIDTAHKVNRQLSGLLESIGIKLVDFKLEFGYTSDHELVLTDEISPDTCRFWNIADGRQLDRDRYRLDLGDIIEAYQEITDRLTSAL